MARMRTLSEQDLLDRLARQSAPVDDCYGDSNPGLAECRSYDRDDTRMKLDMVRDGRAVVEVMFDGRWVDA